MTGPDDRESAEGDELGGGAWEELEPGLLPLLDSEAGPARPLSEREQLLLVDRIERQLQQRGRVLPWRAPRRVVLVGALFAASAAAAVYGVNVLSGDPAPPSQVEGRVGGQAEGARTEVAVPPSPPTSPLPAAPLDGASPAASPPPVVSSPGSDAPAPPSEGEGEEGERPASSASQLGPKLPKELPSGAPKSPPSRATGAVGADRLAAASALRARHRYREAFALYLQVIELAPDGVQASVARVAAAEVQLDHLGDIAGAERLYREAKTQGGELTAEAQFGLAQVARARGDATGERQALQDFLTRHPGSPLVSAARRRLNALGAR